VKPEVITFIEIAKNDFEAAKILFREELYLQAIFMLQQSLEKAIKALLLKFGIVDSEEALKYEIGHNVVENTLQLIAEIICNGIKEIQKQYKDLRTLLQRVEEYAKFACEQYIREKDYLFKQIENFKDKVFEPINEENKKIINMVVDSVSVLS
jgi:HEPN domain-containing protein